MQDDSTYHKRRKYWALIFGRGTGGNVTALGGRGGVQTMPLHPADLKLIADALREGRSMGHD
jgi:hypothetical protein